MNQLVQLTESPENTSSGLERLDIDIALDPFGVELSAMPLFISRVRSLSIVSRKLYDRPSLRLVQGLALPLTQLSCPRYETNCLSSVKVQIIITCACRLTSCITPSLKSSHAAQDIHRAADHTPMLALLALPTEILAHIFILCVEIPRTIYIPFQTQRIPTQIVISHVCSTCRRIALDTPELWTDIFINDPSKNEHVYRAWLSRTRHRPMNLGLDLVSGINHRVLRPASETIDAFWKVVKSVNVKCLKLEIPKDQLFQLVESPANNALHGLEQLELGIAMLGGSVAAAVSTLPQFVNRARSLSFSHPVLRENELFLFIQGLALPWAQLSCLDLASTFMNLSHCTALLLQAPLLEECHLAIILTDVEQGRQLTLPRIRICELFLGVDPDEVLPYFIFPNLTRLTLISGDFLAPTETWEIIKRQYNLRLIQELTLRAIPTTTKFSLHCSTVLRDSPMLRHLDMASFGIIDDKTLEGVSSGSLGHSLKDLSIFCDTNRIEAVLKMVEARQKAVAQRVERGYSWREVGLTSLAIVRITMWDGGKSHREAHKGRLVELERLGAHVEIVTETRNG